MRLSLLFCLFLLSTTLKAKDLQCKYVDNKCVDLNNNECLNVVDPSELFKNFDKQSNGYSRVNAECVDFTGFDFNKYIELKFRNLINWNFKGAKLVKAKLFFANIVDGSLQGANFEELQFGYVNITGIIDSQTKIPKHNCKIDSNKLKCRQ